MTRVQGTAGAAPPWALALTAIVCVQLGSALSVRPASVVGAAGAAWLRLSVGALIFLAFARPHVRSIRSSDWITIAGLGISTGVMSMVFLAAIQRLPLGTAVAIEYLGPMMVATLRARSARAVVWPLLAMAGVVVLTEPWHGELPAAGVGLALASGLGWAAYILLTQGLGSRYTGTAVLSLTTPVAAVVCAAVGIPQAVNTLNVQIAGGVCALALLWPVLPLVLELRALRGMSAHAFGTLMAMEPAVGALLGIVVLHQSLSLNSVVGMALVVAAGVAAQRGSETEPRSKGALTRRSGSEWHVRRRHNHRAARDSINPRQLLPRMTAAEQFRAGRKLRRVPQLLIGLIGYGGAVMILVRSGLGAASWNVLSEGVANSLHISFGWATNLIALAVLATWLPMRELPGLGTALNILVVGLAADATGSVVPIAHGWPDRAAYLIAGVLALAFFDALYLGAQFGSGPRDGLMTGLVRLTGRPFAVVRTGIEIAVASAGYLLGGTVGPGTAVVAVCLGPLVGLFLPRVAVRAATS